MSKIENLYVMTAGILIVAFSYAIDYLENRFAEDNWFWYFFDAFCIAAIFYLTMNLLKWAVWVMG